MNLIQLIDGIQPATLLLGALIITSASLLNSEIKYNSSLLCASALFMIAADEHAHIHAIIFSSDQFLDLSVTFRLEIVITIMIGAISLVIYTIRNIPNLARITLLSGLCFYLIAASLIDFIANSFPIYSSAFAIISAAEEIIETIGCLTIVGAAVLTFECARHSHGSASVGGFSQKALAPAAGGRTTGA
jgi:hypothetical protein